MSDLIFKANIEFEDTEQAQEMARLLTIEDDEDEEGLKDAFNNLGVLKYGKMQSALGELLNANRKNKKGAFAIRDAHAKGDELIVVLEGNSDAAWLMGIGLVMLAEENGGALQEGTLKDPKKDLTLDLIYNGDQARYEESATTDEDDEDDEEEEDEEYGYDDEDFEDDFRDDDF